jgi:DNA-binding beta-propeller fold protein YncE
MKRTLGVFAVVAAGAFAFFASQQRFVEAQGRGGNTAAQAAAAEARAKQEALEKATPQLQFSEEVLPLVMPDHTMGETEGVSLNSKGHLFVYSRTGKGGMARGGTAAELFEFDQNYKFVKQWAPDQYGASFAHAVRVDKYDNVWFVDEGSSMIVKMDPNGVVKMNLGRKVEAIDYLERFFERGEKDTERYPVGGVGTYGRPTDVAWDAQDNIYISDGYTNSRFVKLQKDGTWVKAIGTHGNGPDQFSTPHGIASDGQLVYVADRGNNRIQIYDGATMAFKTSYTGVGAPWSVQVTSKYVYSGDGTGKIYRLDKGSGKLLGWIQVGMGQGQTGCIIHSLHAINDNTLIKGSCSEWNVEKITFKGTSATQ